MRTVLSFFMDTARPGSPVSFTGDPAFTDHIVSAGLEDRRPGGPMAGGSAHTNGRSEPKGDRGELLDVFILSEFMVLGNAVPRLAAHGPEFRRYDALAWFTITLVIYYLVNFLGLPAFRKRGAGFGGSRGSALRCSYGCIKILGLLSWMPVIKCLS